MSLTLLKKTKFTRLVEVNGQHVKVKVKSYGKIKVYSLDTLPGAKWSLRKEVEAVLLAAEANGNNWELAAKATVAQFQAELSAALL